MSSCCWRNIGQLWIVQIETGTLFMERPTVWTDQRLMIHPQLNESIRYQFNLWQYGFAVKKKNYSFWCHMGLIYDETVTSRPVSGGLQSDNSLPAQCHCWTITSCYNQLISWSLLRWHSADIQTNEGSGFFHTVSAFMSYSWVTTAACSGHTNIYVVNVKMSLKE